MISYHRESRRYNKLSKDELGKYLNYELIDCNSTIYTWLSKKSNASKPAYEIKQIYKNIDSDKIIEL